MNSKAVVTAPFSQTQPKSRQIEAARPDSSRQFDYFIGVSPHIAELKDFIGAQATVFHPTLLVGERGLRQEQIFSSNRCASGAMRMLVEYRWERNIDEFEATLESAIANAPPPRIDESVLPDRIRYAALRTIPASGIDLPGVVDDYERSLIETALRQTGGNQTKAAQLLGLRVQTLNMKLKRYAELNRPIVIQTQAAR